MSDTDEELPLDLFTEPEGFRPKTPPPSTLPFTRVNGDVLTLNLISKHSLWGHCLWNAGKSLANYIDNNVSVKDKCILELGAASGLPSLVCALNGAKRVVATDYPDPNILDNLKLNGRVNHATAEDGKSYQVEGLIWGQDSTHLTNAGKFDVILLADLIFNHSEHASMLKSCKECLATDGVVITTFSHHLPEFAKRNMLFFDVATEMGFKFKELYQERWEVMFSEDGGDEEVRRTVHCYKLWL
jgi:EEF1A N-terminal glycine/lysine methyltransferase